MDSAYNSWSYSLSLVPIYSDIVPRVYYTLDSAIQWSPSIMDTTGTKDFVLYSEVSFTQEGDC